jgi:hypothetical protein
MMSSVNPETRSEPAKKAYQAPQLLKYGSLTEMTTAGGTRGKKDNPLGTMKTG